MDGDEPPSDCAFSESSSFLLRPNPMPQLPAKLARRLVAVGPAPAPAPSPRPARELDEVVAGDGIAPMEFREGSTECDRFTGLPAYHSSTGRRAKTACGPPSRLRLDGGVCMERHRRRHLRAHFPHTHFAVEHLAESDVLIIRYVAIA